MTEKLHGRSIWEYRYGPDVDASGEFADGGSFDDIRGLKQQLVSRKTEVARSVVANLMIFATGPRIEISDRETIENIVRRAGEDDFGLRTIVHEVIQSELFQNK